MRHPRIRTARSPWCSRGLLSFALMLGLAACAPEVVRQPAQLTPTTGGSGATIEIAEDASIAVGTGYSRVVRRGSVWSRVGRLVQGEVFKPVFVDRAPGDYEVSAATETEKKLTFTLEAAQERFVRLKIQLGVLVGRIVPELVDRTEADGEIKDLSLIADPLK